MSGKTEKRARSATATLPEDDVEVEPEPYAAGPETKNTLIGWQGMRCVLPPEWSVTGFSMDRANGYLRIDAPGNSALTVQIRWQDVAQPAQKTVYHVVAPYYRRWKKIAEPEVTPPELKANLEKILKETAKQSKKNRSGFESALKPEKTEGPNDERTAINFSWSGEGRGQGKIWYCKTCHRMVVAQVIGLSKDQAAISAVAAQLFASLHDHAPDGFDLWALYDLKMEVPEDFRLESQKLLSGYLSLTFARGAERIFVDRWGLANMTRKRHTLDEWFRSNAMAGLNAMAKSGETNLHGHDGVYYAGKLTLPGRLRAWREARGSLRRFPTFYEGGSWECTDSNRIYAIQTFRNRRSEGLWQEIVRRCECH